MAPNTTKILDPADYTVAWISPLYIEAQAALLALDAHHEGHFVAHPGDDYIYMAGEVNGHNVVIATFPAEHDYGLGSADALAIQVKKSLPKLRFGLLVGVAAGLPNLDKTPPLDIRLGDVLVGVGDGESAGLVNYDLGKQTKNGLELIRHGYQVRTAKIVRSAIARLQLKEPQLANQKGPNGLLQNYERIMNASDGIFADPGQGMDELHRTVYYGVNSKIELVERTKRPQSSRTRVWYGSIGSVNILTKDAKKRDELRDKHNLIGLEMEASDIENTIPVGVIRGVCDYADGQRNKTWQPYAAAMAAAYARAILYQIAPDRRGNGLDGKINDPWKIPGGSNTYKGQSKDIPDNDTEVDVKISRLYSKGEEQGEKAVLGDQHVHLASSEDLSKQIFVYSPGSQDLAEINAVFVVELGQSWISKDLVEHLGLKLVPNPDGKPEYGVLERGRFEFSGSVMLQWCLERGVPSSKLYVIKCRVVPMRLLGVYLPRSSLPSNSKSIPLVVSNPESPQIISYTPEDPVLSRMDPPLFPSAVSVDGAVEYLQDSLEESKLADVWMDLLKTSVHKFISKPPDYLRGTRPVRIAVLDSGLDPGHPFIQGAKRTHRIKEARSFVDHHSGMADTFGHGTHVAALLLEVAPEAQIYVARVATIENIPNDHRIAEAITWAAELEVDIITMSFGLNENDFDVNRAVMTAYSKNIILFAPASNLTIRYPDISNKTICIYSFDANGRPSVLGAPPMSDSGYNFATLGKGVRSALPNYLKGGKTGERRMSGTHIATPIAAGIAACFLEFFLMHDPEKRNGALYNKLRCREGIQKLLATRLTEKREGFDYIIPWKLFSPQRTDEEIYLLIAELFSSDTSPSDSHADLDNGSKLAHPIDSDYHSDPRTDADSIFSADSLGSSLGIPLNVLEDFINIFTKSITKQPGVSIWGSAAVHLQTPSSIERKLRGLIKDYTIELEQKAKHDLEKQALSLIRRCRRDFARCIREKLQANQDVENPENFQYLKDFGAQLSSYEKVEVWEGTAHVELPLEPEEGNESQDENTDFTEDIGVEFTDVKAFLTTGAAFQHLLQRMRAQLYFDGNEQLARIREVIMSSSVGADPEANSFGGLDDKILSCSISWDILEFVQMYVDDGDAGDLASVITLTGSALFAQAATCGEYLKQTWPSTSTNMLSVLQAALSNEDRTASVKHPNVEISIELGEPTLVSLKGSGDAIVEVVQQLAWIGSAFRASKNDRIEYCEATISRLKAGFVSIAFENIPLLKEEEACWYPLFTNPVIARGFPIPSRGNEIGLEIPLEMMAALGGAIHATDFEGGLILKGFSTAFIPTKKEKDLIQWHCLHNSDGSIISYRDAILRSPNRMLLSDVNLDNMRARAILGWWPTAESRLGAEDIKYKDISWSNANGVKRSVKLSGVGVGLSHIVTGALTFSMSDRDQRLLIKKENSFLQRIIECASKIPTVLFDTSKRRGYLVPALDTILHMIMTKVIKKEYKVNGDLVTPKFSNPARDGFEATRKCLIENLSLKLVNKLNDLALADKDYLFKDLFLELWSSVSCLLEKSVEQASAPGETVKLTMRDFLCGWEFMDLVDDVHIMVQNEVNINKTSGGWVNLIEDIGSAVVFFAAELGDLILPAKSGRLCDNYKTVPRDRDYLAMGVPMLKMLYERAGPQETKKRITRKGLLLHQLSGLFENCPAGAAPGCKCVRLQQLFYDTLFTFGRLRPPGPFKEGGAIIIGTEGIFRPSNAEMKSPEAIYSQPNVRLMVGGGEESIKACAVSPSTSSRSSDERDDENLCHTPPQRPQKNGPTTTMMAWKSLEMNPHLVESESKSDSDPGQSSDSKSSILMLPPVIKKHIQQPPQQSRLLIDEHQHNALPISIPGPASSILEAKKSLALTASSSGPPAAFKTLRHMPKFENTPTPTSTPNLDTDHSRREQVQIQVPVRQKT